MATYSEASIVVNKLVKEYIDEKWCCGVRLHYDSEGWFVSVRVLEGSKAPSIPSTRDGVPVVVRYQNMPVAYRESE